MIEVNKIYCEDCRETIKRMDDDSIDCLVTSPPYWGLRDYGAETIAIWDSVNGCLHEWGELIEPAGDIRNRGQGSIVGANRDFGKQYVGQKVQFCKKCGAWRGSLGLEPDFRLYLKHLVQIFELFKPKLKKTGTMWINLGDTYSTKSGSMGTKFDNQPKYKAIKESTNFEQPDTDLPEKTLIGIPDRFKIAMIDTGWICRNEIIWHKPNCMPASVKDRFTVDFEKIYFFVKSPRYYFKQQFEPYIEKLNRWGGEKLRSSSHKYIEIGEPKLGKFGATSMYRKGRPVRPNDQGRNKRCVWTITTKGSPEAHFAIYPDQLPAIPIKAGSPPGGIIYDPFGGSGTTAEVALRLDRNFIISEISSKYVDEISEKRINNEKSKLKLAL